MRKILLCLLMGFMALSINEVKAEVYGSISGRVIDQATQKGVENAYVLISGSSKKSITDENGNYVFPLVPSGDYELILELEFLSDNLLKKYNYEYVKKLPVSLKSGTNVLDANFYLEKIGSILGKVYFSDNTTPVIDGEIFAFNTSNVSSGRNLFFTTLGYNTTNIIRDFSITGVYDHPNWQLLYVDRRKGTTSAYLYDSSLEVSNGNGIQNVNFELKPYANTKIYGQLKDKYGNNLSNVFTRVYFYFVKNRITYHCNPDKQGKYILQGDIVPGEYKITVMVDEFETDGETVKASYRDDNNSTVLININEQKELNIIYDSSSAKKIYSGSFH